MPSQSSIFHTRRRLTPNTHYDGSQAASAVSDAMHDQLVDPNDGPPPAWAQGLPYFHLHMPSAARSNVAGRSMDKTGPRQSVMASPARVSGLRQHHYHNKSDKSPPDAPTASRLGPYQTRDGAHLCHSLKIEFAFD